jgi:L-threonylcarbamoyladenylate synthase
MSQVELIERAVKVLQCGGVVAYPTDTLYGLAVDPRSAEAVRRLFAIKRREPGHAVPLIAADLPQAEAAAVFDRRARRVAHAFWPGPLSIVVPATDRLCAEVRAEDGSVAVRVPSHRVPRELAAAFGFCITATSANRTGAPATASAAIVAAVLGSDLDLLLDAGDSPGGPPSTIVDLRGAKPILVRSGAVAWDRVLRSIE